MSNKKTIINWELTLHCNLDCSFCSQQERRYKQKKEITEQEAKKIIDHLPKNCHLSFLGWETLLFPNIKNIFSYLEKKDISFEITTNATLGKTFFEELKQYKKLEKINISIDGYGDFHDLSRGKKGLFEKIIATIEVLSPEKYISVSTFVSPHLSHESLQKLYFELNKRKVPEQKLVYCMSFWEQEKILSQEKIPELLIAQPWETKKEERLYKKSFFEKLLILKKQEDITKVSFEPDGIIWRNHLYCKQIDEQYRINENGEISTCEFIKNSFWNLIENSFEDIIEKNEYKNLKQKIQFNFPLEICKNCCKLSKHS